MLNEIASIFDYQIKAEPLPTIPDHLLQICQSQFPILYIVGDSGQGKTTILNQLTSDHRYHNLAIQHNDEVLAERFTSKEDAIEKLTMAGLSSIPTWFRPYNQISSGEQARANIAFGLNNFVVIDEFTSNLDRLTARSLSYCIKRFVTRNQLHNIILVGCQYDIIPWLQPTYVYDLNVKDFITINNTLSKWTVTIENNSYHIDDKRLILRSVPRDRWSHYSKYHYLTSSLLTNSNCWEAFVKIENIERAVGFIAIVPLPSGTVTNAVREHRLVVIPSCQGLGIGVSISETIAKYYVNSGARYFTKTSHPRLGQYRDNNSSWRPTAKNHKSLSNKQLTSLWSHTNRICYCHEYILTSLQPNPQTSLQISNTQPNPQTSLQMSNIQPNPQISLHMNNIQSNLQMSNIQSNPEISNIQPNLQTLLQMNNIQSNPEISNIQPMIQNNIQQLTMNVTLNPVYIVETARDKLEKDNGKLSWYPLKIYGTLTADVNGNVTAKIDHKSVCFKISEHGSNVLNAGQNHLMNCSRSKTTNLYAIVNNLVYIDLSIDNKGTCLAKIDTEYLSLLMGKVWRERNNRVYFYGEGHKRVYIEDILFPNSVIISYIDGNKLNNSRANLVFA